MSNPNCPEPERMDDFFNSRAEGYDAHMLEFSQEFYAAVKQSFAVTEEPLQILDIGCGTGLEFDGIFDRVPNAQLSGIDLSENMLTQLQIKHEARMSQITTKQGSYLEIPFPKGKYDYCLSVMTVHHLLPQKRLQLYQKIIKALKPGGKYIEADFIVSPKEEERALAEYYANMGSQGDDIDGFYHLDIPMSIQSVSQVLKEAGFTAINVVWETEAAAILDAQITTT